MQEEKSNRARLLSPHHKSAGTASYNWQNGMAADKTAQPAENKETWTYCL